MNFHTTSGKIVIGGVIIACVVAGWILAVQQQASQSNQKTQMSQGVDRVVSPTEGMTLGRPEARLPYLKDVGGDFTLTGPLGSEISLHDYQGQVVLLYFGYTTCPDACPLTLAEIQQIMHLLGEQAKQIQPLFITFDPERDTPEHLQTYLTHFYPTFVGLTGTPEAIAQVAKQYQMLYIKQEVGSAAGYLFAHTGYLYLIDQQGRLRQRYKADTSVEQIVQDIQYLLPAKNA